MRMAATTFAGVSLIRNWLKRSRMSSGRRGEARTLPQRMRCTLGLEGIVSKRLTSVYRSGPALCQQRTSPALCAGRFWNGEIQCLPACAAKLVHGLAGAHSLDRFRRAHDHRVAPKAKVRLAADGRLLRHKTLHRFPMSVALLADRAARGFH